MQGEDPNFSNQLVHFNNLFIFINSRKAARPKTKANNLALDIGYPQWAQKSCQHLLGLSLQAPWVPAGRCQSLLLRQTFHLTRKSFYDSLVRKFSIFFQSNRKLSLVWFVFLFGLLCFACGSLETLCCWKKSELFCPWVQLPAKGP